MGRRNTSALAFVLSSGMSPRVWQRASRALGGALGATTRTRTEASHLPATRNSNTSGVDPLDGAA